MQNIDEERARQIRDVLEKRGASLPCPRCGTRKFHIMDGYFNNPLQQKDSGLALGGEVVPCAVIICENCGYLSQHALGILGLLVKERTNEQAG